MASVTQYSLCFLFLLLFSLLQPFSTSAQTYKNVSLGQSLTANDDNSFWASPSGEFGFGFRTVGPGGFLLAIWFDKIPEKTIVWSANRNNLVEKGSKVELTNESLVLKNTKGETIWNANIPPSTEVANAAMLDTGNFVVVGSSDSLLLWESFKNPTDTILPMQAFGRGHKLFARYQETNYSKGRFLFTMKTDGILVLSTTLLNSEDADDQYWQSETEGNGDQLMFNQSGSIYITSRNGSILQMLSENAPYSTQDFYHRAILEYDGVFRHYIYPKHNKSDATVAWSALPQVIPSNICIEVYDEGGSAPCGPNSYCTYDSKKNRPSCHCPDGYSLIDTDDFHKGCKRDFAPQFCGKESMNLFDFYVMENSDWMGGDYEHVIRATEDNCRQACLADCLCAAIVVNPPNCFKKKYPLVHGRNDPSILWKAFIKIRKDNSTFGPEDGDGGGDGDGNGNGDGDGDGKKKIHSTTLVVIIIVSILLCISLSINFFQTFFSSFGFKNKTTKVAGQQIGMNLQCFTHKELEGATGKFKEKLGSGAAGTVFKGSLHSDGVEHYVAVKRLEHIVNENETEFLAEVNAIGRTNHRNVVQLLGFCNEGQHRLLVYEYMSNGSLANFLFGDSKLIWKQRIQIALGTARGLLYLHEECSNVIIHCDIKPQNILLDDTFSARISDFGLAKILKIDRTQTNTAIRGTKGYVAPEWFRHMPVTAMVDVYSYGILLLELVCSRKIYEAEAEDENQMILSDWAYDCYVDMNLIFLVENDEEAMHDMETVEKYVMTAIWCIQEDPLLRPTMKQVIQMLEGTLNIPAPPHPSP